MRLSLATLALAPLALATAAHANDFTFTFSGADGETNQPYNESFTIDTSNLYKVNQKDPGFACSGKNCFTAQSTGLLDVFNRAGEIDELTDGQFNSPGESIYLFTDADMNDPLTLFTGSGKDPVIATGDFYAYIYFPEESFSPYGTLDIVDPPSASAVPEPSTLALLGTGILTAAGAVRRRLA